MTDWRDTMTELWDKYRPYYSQANDGMASAYPYVLEHAIVEHKLCLDAGEQEDENAENLRLNTINQDVSVIENVVSEGRVETNNSFADLTCQTCGRDAKGVVKRVTLPTLGVVELSRYCLTCVADALKP